MAWGQHFKGHSVTGGQDPRENRPSLLFGYIRCDVPLTEPKTQETRTAHCLSSSPSVHATFWHWLGRGCVDWCKIISLALQRAHGVVMAGKDQWNAPGQESGLRQGRGSLATQSGSFDLNAKWTLTFSWQVRECSLPCLTRGGAFTDWSTPL